MKSFTIGLYFFICILLTVFTYSFIDPNLVFYKNLYTGLAFNARTTVSIIYIFFLIVFFIFYWLFYIWSKKEKLAKNEIIFLIGGTVIVLLFSYPAILSYDIFNYVTTAKVAYFYHENPYIVMPIEFIGDPNLLFTHAANKIALYGPSWLLLSAIPYIFGFGNFLLELFNFKLVASFFYVFSSYFLWKISKSSSIAILFSLNPLIIFETLISGHNDILMIFFGIVSFYFIFKRMYFISLLFLLISIGIKYATIFLLPVAFYMILKFRKKEKVEWHTVFIYSFFLMTIPFLLSPFREELYPWYAVWLIPFTVFFAEKKVYFYLLLTMSFSLLLRYVPYMLLGTYSGIVPVLKILLTIVPMVIFFIGYGVKSKIWQKVSF